MCVIIICHDNGCLLYKRLYHWFTYMMFFHDAFIGLISCFIRILLSMLFSLLFIMRMDHVVLMRGLESLDTGVCVCVCVCVSYTVLRCVIFSYLLICTKFVSVMLTNHYTVSKLLCECYSFISHYYAELKLSISSILHVQYHCIMSMCILLGFVIDIHNYIIIYCSFPAHKTYVGFIYMEYIQNNSIMNVFVDILCKQVIEPPRKIQGSLSEFHRSRSSCECIDSGSCTITAAA